MPIQNTKRPRRFLLDCLHSRWLVVLAAGLVFVGAMGHPSVAWAEDGERPLRPRMLKIVNGEVTSDFESTVALLDETGRSFCSGVLIGCSTVLTAAHCLCEEDGTECGPDGPGLLTSPSQVTVFAQHGGLRSVESFDINEGFLFGDGKDVALLHLGEQISGIRPSQINDIANPMPSTPAIIAGFGLTAGNLETPDSGLKRAGSVLLEVCDAVPLETHLCWRFNEPMAAPGTDSNTCMGDSGGPLFIDNGGDMLVAGVASGGTSDDCLAPDEGFDTDIYGERLWIREFGGDDIDNTMCGDLPVAGGPETLIVEGQGRLDGAISREVWTVDVPADTQLLRVAVNGLDPDGNDFDLALRFGAVPDGVADECTSLNDGMYEVCEIADPESGVWHVAVDRVTGEGDYQIVATTFAGTGGDDGGGDDGGGDDGGGTERSSICPDEPDSLCLGTDGRFKVSVDWLDFGGDTGVGQPVSIDRRDSGLFYFFGEDNIELLVKVLDGCGINQRYWVFSAATTTVQYTLTVEDTETGQTRRYSKPIDLAVPPVTDTSAFAACP